MGLSIFAQYGLILHNFFLLISSPLFPLIRSKLLSVVLSYKIFVLEFMIGCRVRCKSWIRSHIVAGCFFGKLERFDREFQLCINQLCKTLIDDGLNICDPPHWLLPKALCPQFQSGWLAGGNRCFLRKKIGQFCCYIQGVFLLVRPKND